MGGRGAKGSGKRTRPRPAPPKYAQVGGVTVNRTVYPFKQNQHILGDPAWVEESRRLTAGGKNPKSAFYKHIDPQAIIDMYSGKGTVEITSRSKYPTEYVTLKNNIGVTYDAKIKKFIPTNRIQIVYSSKGAHAFPTITKKG